MEPENGTPIKSAFSRTCFMFLHKKQLLNRQKLNNSGEPHRDPSFLRKEDKKKTTLIITVGDSKKGLYCFDTFHTWFMYGSKDMPYFFSQKALFYKRDYLCNIHVSVHLIKILSFRYFFGGGCSDVTPNARGCCSHTAFKSTFYSISADSGR